MKKGSGVWTECERVVGYVSESASALQRTSTNYGSGIIYFKYCLSLHQAGHSQCTYKEHGTNYGSDIMYSSII